MNMHEISSMIEIRKFLSGSIEDLSIKLSREQIKSVQNKIALLGKEIIERSLALDLSEKGAGISIMKREIKIESTEDTESVMKKFMTAESKPSEDSEHSAKTT